MKNKPLHVELHHYRQENDHDSQLCEGAWCSSQLNHHNSYLLISKASPHLGEASPTVTIVSLTIVEVNHQDQLEAFQS